MNKPTETVRDLADSIAMSAIGDLLQAGVVAMEAMDAAKHQLHGKDEFRPVWTVLDTAIGKLGNKLLKYGDYMGNIGQTPPFALRQLEGRLKVGIRSRAPQEVKDFLRDNGYGWLVDEPYMS